jgi:hypothetical protein
VTRSILGPTNADVVQIPSCSWWNREGFPRGESAGDITLSAPMPVAHLNATCGVYPPKDLPDLLAWLRVLAADGRGRKRSHSAQPGSLRGIPSSLAADELAGASAVRRWGVMLEWKDRMLVGDLGTVN